MRGRLKKRLRQKTCLKWIHDRSLSVGDAAGMVFAYERGYETEQDFFRHRGRWPFSAEQSEAIAADRFAWGIAVDVDRSIVDDLRDD